MNIFYRLLKFKLSLMLLENINVIFYLSGVYTLDKDIIVTEKKKGEEILLHFGNLQQLNKYNSKNSNNIIIKTIKNNKYLGHNKLIKDYKSFIGCKKYNLYHILASTKENANNNSDKVKSNSKISNIENGDEEKINLYDENNELFLFNDIASQASSASSIASINILKYNNKVNKKIKNEEDIIKKFITVKIILILAILGLFIFIIFQGIYLINLQKSIDKGNNFYLTFFDYSSNFYTLYFSILSLICLADSPRSYNCIHLMNEITKMAVTYSNTNTNITSTDIISNYSDNFFIDFTKLIFVQNEIMYQNLENKLEKIINYLALLDKNDELMNYFKGNASHYKINQIIINNNIKLLLTEESFEFYDFFLLMTSRFGIIIKDYNSLMNPIYILNKTGEEVFNNIFVSRKLNSYQENIYLMILDYNLFLEQLDLILYQILGILFGLKNKFKKVIYIFINLSLLFIILILLVLFCYLGTYFLVVFKILEYIITSLNEKIGDIFIKDIIRKKVDNLKLHLKFYENDINVTLNNLNNIYNNYQDKYNLKIKAESKLLKKEGKTEIKNNNKKSFLKLVKIIKKFNLHKYSKRKELYSYTLLFIIIISLSLYIIGMIIWIFYFKKDDTVSKWVNIGTSFNLAVSKFMNNFLMMLYNNRTLEEISSTFESKDCISNIFEKLAKLYEGDKYFKKLDDITSINDQNINFDCQRFYQNLENELFVQLKNKFVDKQEQLYATMYFFCEWSNIMMFKKYKIIYFQLFNQVKKMMENLKNKNYNKIIEFIYNNEIVKIEIIFLIIINNKLLL